MDNQHAVLIKYMGQHRGHAHAVSSTMLAAILSTSNEIAREVYGDIVRSGEALLGSDGKGYFMIEDREDFDLSTSHLIGRVSSISQRLRSLNRMWGEKDIVPMPNVLGYIKQARLNLGRGGNNENI